MGNRRQLKSNRFLPEFVTRFKDRHGKERLRFRRKGYPDHYFKSALGTEEFRVEYRQCMSAQIAADTMRARSHARAVPGSIDDLLNQYFATPERLGPTKQTQTKVRAVLEKFREGRGERAVADLRFDHIEAILAKRRQKVLVGSRAQGGVEAARKLRKELVRLFAFAMKIGMLDANPAQLADRIKVAPAERSKGFHTWTEGEIAQYRARHPLGTNARLAMELILWTDQRRVDSIHLGRQHIQDGRFKITQTKTGKTLWIAIAPQLIEAIVAMPPKPALCFLVNDTGKPFTNAGFGNKMREWCDEAGLPHCTAHGLRKATMRRMAELDMGNQTMKAMSGHTNDDEVARYTREANQKRMADTAVSALARWEMSNLGSGLDTKSALGADNAG